MEEEEQEDRGGGRGGGLLNVLLDSLMGAAPFANKRGVASVTIQSADSSGAEENSGGDDDQKAPGEGV